MLNDVQTFCRPPTARRYPQPIFVAKFLPLMTAASSILTQVVVQQRQLQLQTTQQQLLKTQQQIQLQQQGSSFKRREGGLLSNLKKKNKITKCVATKPTAFKEQLKRCWTKSDALGQQDGKKPLNVEKLIELSDEDNLNNLCTYLGLNTGYYISSSCFGWCRNPRCLMNKHITHLQQYPHLKTNKLAALLTKYEGMQ